MTGNGDTIFFLLRLVLLANIFLLKIGWLRVGILYFGSLSFIFSFNANLDLLFRVVPRFDELRPPQEVTEAKIQEFLKLPAEKRSFGVVADCLYEDLSSCMAVNDSDHVYR